MESTNTIRTVAKIISAQEGVEGGGFRVQRPFPTDEMPMVDPFLLLDEMGPTHYKPGEAVGAPDHPHRGFETVTYLFAGSMEHKDSHGHAGKLTPGDVQWMTAGYGVVHSELPEAKFLRTGGQLHGVQLWVNLPAKDKLIKPHYQEIPSAYIPVATTPDGLVSARVIAGEFLNTKAVIETRTPIMYIHLTVQPGGSIAQLVPGEYNVFGYIIDGEGTFGPNNTPATDAQMVVFNNDGNTVSIHVPSAAHGALNMLLIGGKPLNEPVARYGPFVMNTQEEIRQAVKDYRAGKFGNIDF